MDDEPVSTRLKDHRNYFSSAPGRLAPASTALGVVSQLTDEIVPLAAVADEGRPVCYSDVRHERDITTMFHAGGTVSVAKSTVMTVPSCGRTVVLGRRGSTLRRVPGIVRRSLQEQELRELLEAVKQTSVAEQAHTPGVCSSQSEGEPDVAPHAQKGTDVADTCANPRAGKSMGVGASLSSSGGVTMMQTRVEAPEGEASEASTVTQILGSPHSHNSCCHLKDSSNVPEMGTSSDCQPATTAVLVKTKTPIVPVGVATDPESHPLLGVYRSSREPLDQLSFEHLKRRIEGAVKEDGAGPASMSRLIEYFRNSKRFDEGEIVRLEARCREEAEGAGSSTADNDGDDDTAKLLRLQEEDSARGGDGTECALNSLVVASTEDDCCPPAASPPQSSAPPAPGSLSQVILKFTTVADGNEAPSFAVGREGATVGRGTSNDICVPTDSCMGDSNHASIVWKEGAFHVQDRGHPYGASIRIGTGTGLREWPLDQGSVFSAGNSVFHTKEIDDERGMLLEIVAGPLKGERRRVCNEGATVGRATENTISIADRELSRHHSTVECDDRQSHSSPSGGGMDGQGPDVEGASGRSAQGSDRDNYSGDGEEKRAESDGRTEFFLCDVGSTNGTYVQLVGPYAGSRRLELSDHILIGRTGFSINRFDWGVWEDRGARRTMEDKSVVIQDMGVEPLTALGLGPQTFIAVYDGHGGAEASAYLWQRLHMNVAEALEEAAPQIAAALEEDRDAEHREVEQIVHSALNNGSSPLENDAEYTTGETDPASDADIFAPVGGMTGDEAEEGRRIAGQGGAGGVGDPGMANLGGGQSSPSNSLAGGNFELTPPTHPPPPPPTCDAAPPPALVNGAHTGGGQACGTGEVMGLPGVPTIEVEGKNEVDGKREDHETKSWAGVDEPPANLSSGGMGAGEWRWEGRESTASVAMVPRPVGAAVSTEKQSSAPSLPEEWLLGARALAGADKLAPSEGMGSSLQAPVEGREGSRELVAGGEAASGVQNERDGAGGALGGSSIERTISSLRALGCCAFDSDSTSGDMPWVHGRDSPAPTSSEVRSRAQSPGGGPSRSLATAGLPAEGESGGRVSQKHDRKGGMEQEQLTTAVDRVMEEVVSQAFFDTDEDFLSTSSTPSCGSTATTAMILGDRFYCFNLGDSRTVLCRSGQVILASRDHKPHREDEMVRIKQAGGMVIHERVMGELAVSRAFGDKAFKMGIKAILREEQEARQLAEEYDEETVSEMLLPQECGFGQDDAGEMESLTSMEGKNSLTIGRGNPTIGSGVPLPSCAYTKVPPPAIEAPLPPVPPPSPPQSAPKVADSVVTPEARVPITDPTDALITARPEMLSCRLTPEDEFVLLACDGLFDVFSNEEVVDFVREEMRQHGDTQRVCEALTRKAIDERYTRDNVSVVLVVLKKFW